MASSSETCYILEQRPKILELILAYCTYDEIAHLRVVCKEFDKTCQSLLNRGFIAVDRYHDKCLKKVKAQLPRRESERRNHPLARHCDILTAVETRLSLLGMTFMKYVDNNLCCFIPGKVIDEIYRVLRYVESTTTPRRSHEILQELRDISSMAMEHFDEKIVPTLKDKMASSPLALSPHGSFSLPGHTLLLSPPRSTQWLPGMRHDVNKFQQNVKQTSGVVNVIRKGLAEHKSKISELGKKTEEQEKQLEEQNRLLSEQHNKIADQESRLNEMNRKLLEYDQKFADLMAEFVRCREAVCHSNPTSSFENNKANLVSSSSGVSSWESKHKLEDFPTNLTPSHTDDPSSLSEEPKNDPTAVDVDDEPLQIIAHNTRKRKGGGSKSCKKTAKTSKII